MFGSLPVKLVAASALLASAVNLFVPYRVLKLGHAREDVEGEGVNESV